jgi:serine/threonine-protein kinase
MFADEARTVARIHHPNVVHALELDSDEAGLYLVMEYLEGESVAGLMRRLATLGEHCDPWLAVHIVAEACAGLHAAHELSDVDGTPLRIVHRDVTPQNLFVTYGGHVKVLDFGIAIVADRGVHTRAGQVKGKFAYMSPEQVAAKPLDRRSDVFGLGVVLHELLTGHRLYRRDSDLETLRAVCEVPAAAPSSIRPSLPVSLDKVCARALSIKRAQRYGSAAELRGDLLAAARLVDLPDSGKRWRYHVARVR